MRASRSVRDRVSGVRVLTYTLPDVSKSVSKNYRSEKLLSAKPKDCPKQWKVETLHPQACLCAAGHRVYQEEESAKKAEENGNRTGYNECSDQVLTQDEVDALLAAVSDGQV